MGTDGSVDCTEIKVNSIPINSFTNYGLSTGSEPTWGAGNHIIITEYNLTTISYSHSAQFQAAISPLNSFTCNPGYYGTYEITANVIIRNTSGQRLNPCIGIAINDDTTNVDNQPEWYLLPHYQSPFSVQYVRMSEGKVCNLTCKRIHHFTDSIEKVSINTYIEVGTDASPIFSGTLADTGFQLYTSTIQFKYLGNFDNIQN